MICFEKIHKKFWKSENQFYQSNYIWYFRYCILDIRFQSKEIVQWFLAWTEMFIEYTVPKSATYMKTGHGHVKKEKPSLRTVLLLLTLSKYIIQLCFKMIMIWFEFYKSLFFRYLMVLSHSEISFANLGPIYWSPTCMASPKYKSVLGETVWRYVGRKM